MISIIFALLAWLLGWLPWGVLVFFIGLGLFMHPAGEGPTVFPQPEIPENQNEGLKPMSHVLPTEVIQTKLENLPGWRYEAQALKKNFRFQNFREAISFIVRLSFQAEELNHHPELHNVYNQVEIVLTTHDVGNQVTEKDIQLAEAIEAFNWVK